MIQINEIQAASIITKSNLPEADYVINPYIGCMHGCVYCYAVFMKRFTDHSEKWGEFVDVKINAAELIPEQTGKYEGKSILLSSVTDAYQPIEKKYGLTRKILEKLIPLQPDLSILTKSDLVLRDIDLLKRFKDCEVGLTISTLDDDLRREIEPFASPIAQRIKTLENLKAAGIKTYVFIGPILPFLTDWEKIVLETRHCADHYMFENLNISGPLWPPVEHWLKTKRPNLLRGYHDIYFSENVYWDKIENEIAEFCKEQKISCGIYFHHK